MAAGLIPAPGTEHGPCTEPCTHSDCEKSRSDAFSICTLCHKGIGYEQRYYRDRFADGVFVYTHQACIEAKEAKRSKLKEEAR